MQKTNIIISALVSTTIVLLSMSLSPEVVSVATDSDGLQHQNPFETDGKEALIQHQLSVMENSVNSLLEKHSALVNRNFILEQRISQLEQLPQPMTSEWSRGDDSVQRSTQTAEEIQYEEEMMTLDSKQNEFGELVNQMDSEGYDADWHGEMQASFQAVEERLRMFQFDSMSITHSECTSQSCLVEYTYDDKTDPHTLSGLLAAQGASEVILKHESDGSMNKTLALYKR